jgi:hypothetical protein
MTLRKNKRLWSGTGDGGVKPNHPFPFRRQEQAHSKTSSCASGNFLLAPNPRLTSWAIDISALQAFGCFVLGLRVLHFLVCVSKVPAETARFLNRMVSISMTYASMC